MGGWRSTSLDVGGVLCTTVSGHNSLRAAIAEEERLGRDTAEAIEVGDIIEPHFVSYCRYRPGSKLRPTQHLVSVSKLLEKAVKVVPSSPEKFREAVELGARQRTVNHREERVRLVKPPIGPAPGKPLVRANAVSALTGEPHTHSNFAGTENGFVASTTNIISAVNSVVPLLKTSIVVWAECPLIEPPSSTWLVPVGVR
jgi:hypothetical protein